MPAVDPYPAHQVANGDGRLCRREKVSADVYAVGGSAHRYRRKTAEEAVGGAVGDGEGFLRHAGLDVGGEDGQGVFEPVSGDGQIKRNRVLAVDGKGTARHGTVIK